jgi:hypothetical protein
MFPDPETFNPLRWVEPGWPTYQEPLTQFPTVINCTQFGYGRRTCQGQTVADEDMFIGIGSIAWLFNIARRPEDTSDPVSVLDVVVDPEKVESHSIGLNVKATISQEELNTGSEDPKSPTMEDTILSKFIYPGSFPADVKDTIQQAVEMPKQAASKLDPTLDFSTLLIAKPLPFKFSLKPRDDLRAAKVRELFSEGVEKGEYSNSREYWGENQGKNKPLGWSKV